MKIAFLYPQWTGGYGVFGHFARRQSKWPPINLALLAAIVEECGHEAVIIDGEVLCLSEEKMVELTMQYKPDLIGLTCYSPFFHLNVDLAKALKEAGCKAPICVGGPHITITQKKILEDIPYFDYLFIGEAEASLPRFLDVFGKGGDVSQIKGIALRKNGIPTDGEPQWIETKIITKGNNLGQEYSLDQFPFPARHLLPMRKYKIGTKHGRMAFTSIQSMRGCPWKCIFCASDKLNTTRMALRSPESLVDEIEEVIARYGVKHLYFVDDVLTLWPDHITAICKLIISRDIKITFEGSTRAHLVEDELFRLMAQAGLVRLSFGLETVNEEMRKIMKKQVMLKHYSEANRICNKYGIEAINSCIIGLPGETRETFKELLDFLLDNRHVSQANFAIAVPYPGTELSDMAMNGTHGIQLLTKEGDFSKYLRYGSAVTQVGELTPKDLLGMQNEAFLLFYSRPWRWPAMFKKHGLMGFVLLGLRKYRYWKAKRTGNYTPVYDHPKDY